ncbi:hypothetical protein C0991_000429 [Blastosporella zonata]|nr:hypothetical protein C0991_000429 [Blastosporella zonata]
MDMRLAPAIWSLKRLHLHGDQPCKAPDTGDAVLDEGYKDLSSANKKTIAWMNANPDKLNPPCFYSGYTEVSGKQVYAWQILKTKWIGHDVPSDCRVIGDIVKAAGAKGSDIKDWSTVSQAFAERVKGQVYLLLGQVVSAKSVWLNYETPALLDNTKVTGVQLWQIDVDGKPEGEPVKTKGTA